MQNPTLEKLLQTYDKKFHKRIWNIVKEASPSSYAQAEALGLLEGDGPQIYGEMKQFLKKAFTQGMIEGIKMVELKPAYFTNIKSTYVSARELENLKSSLITELEGEIKT